MAPLPLSEVPTSIKKNMVVRGQFENGSINEL